MTGKKRIIAIGANPTWQKTLFFDRFTPGEVNRAKEMLCFASGKGINFSRAATVWDKAQVTLLQFTGGHTGELVQCYLGEHDSFFCVNVDTSPETRVCTTCLCLESCAMTEIIDPSGTPSDQDAATFLQHFAQSSMGCDGVAICGTLQKGLDIEIYVAIARLAAQRGTTLLVDSYQNIDRVLSAGHPELLLKINRHELSMLTGKDDMADGIRKLFSHYAPRLVAITDGPARAALSDGTRLYSYTLPHLEKIVNPLGSGDTASAIFLSEYLSAADIPQTFARALAAASANCLSVICGSFDKDDARAIYDKITIEENKL